MSDVYKPCRAPWEFECKPFEIVDQVYYVGNTSVSSHLFDTGDGLLLLDTTYGETTYLLLESIRELGFDPHDIKWLIHSHAHIDHFGGTRRMVEKYGCKTYLPAADMEILDDRDLNWCSEVDLPYEAPYDYHFEVDVQMKPGDVYTFGNLTMKVYNAAGHTPGTVALLFELPCGLNAIMHGGIGKNTLSAAYAEKRGLGPAWRDNFRSSLKELQEKQLKVDIILGNHPLQNDTFGKQQRKTADCNPFIEPGRWDTMLTNLRNMVAKMDEEDPIK